MESLTNRFRRDVFLPYVELLKAQYRFHPVFSHARRIWEEKLTEEELVNGPYLEKAQSYEKGEPLEVLGLHQETIATIQKKLNGLPLYRHQSEALRLLMKGNNAVIATGTSSGKTLCYQIPILDDLIRSPLPGLRALVIYPLNALVNDQLNEWEQLLAGHSEITFARFTGQTPNNQREYEDREKAIIKEQLQDEALTQQELQKQVSFRLQQKLSSDIPNRLNHREAIRANPPQVLITNFSMLEYLLERPIDTPIFDKARLKFLVLDEAHAYRGVQSTEIAFLIRRLKNRLATEKLTCIVTSATLGKPGDTESMTKVRRFASELFGQEFDKPNPINGTAAEPQLRKPSFRPGPNQYLTAAEYLHTGNEAKLNQELGAPLSNVSFPEVLTFDENLYRLRKDILTKPIQLKDAANLLWSSEQNSENGLQALLEIVAAAKAKGSCEDLLPTRLHYFVRAQDGLHICLHKQCPSRRNDLPAFFVSRQNGDETPDGYCPGCNQVNRKSLLVEIVTCRKCGYLFGALQDLGPRRAQHPSSESDAPKPYFDSFSTELGWAADSFWSYLSVDDELSFPIQSKPDDDEEDQDDLFRNPVEVEWCVQCGKKRDNGGGDNCNCEYPYLRKIRVFHRQCPHSGSAKDYNNLYSQEKKLLTSCPNCGARNGSGLEPLRRFQESDDETGLAMAIPLAHFQVSPNDENGRQKRKLLSFTDHRQRAAAFPSLLEEETFAHDMGRQMVKIAQSREKPIDVVSLGECLSAIADSESPDYNPDFFLPTSRFPDEDLDAKGKRDLWVAETLSYFGIPDSARESAEDLGLIAVEYRLKEIETQSFHALLQKTELSIAQSSNALQTLLTFLRQNKAFTFPKGRVEANATAFGRVTADISYVLRREGIRNTRGWLPRLNNDGSYRDNYITSYLRRLLNSSPAETMKLAERIWEFLVSRYILIENKRTWKLDHERIYIVKSRSRYLCSRCGIISTYSANQCCPRKECEGKLEQADFDPKKENIIARWVAGSDLRKFTTLKSEEHTAQINKDLAKRIEDEFRAGGVDLLSSTTTFELGINIGDLQKVLLRNAPPTSASYVQRVGRAGRGNDKNSVCVTLCRRTKYDSDAWKDPSRLMSGVVRPPTVFLSNYFIAQRHFNAVAFARFLRIRLFDQDAMGEVKQQIPLGPFLTVESRANIPDDWFKFRPTNLFLDFVPWLRDQKEVDLFQTASGRSLLSTISGIEMGKNESIKGYKKVLVDVSEELSALALERKKLVDQGKSISDIDQAIKNLLESSFIDVLAKRGFLPRYAFPLDVVSLETGWSRWSRDVDVELSRDRGIAIAEFAPGAQVIAHKKVFTSSGLYVVSKIDAPRRDWYSRCPSCDQIRTSPTQDKLIGPCSVCSRPITTQYIKPFVEPRAFSIRIEKKGEGVARHRRNTLVRQRQTLTHFIDSVEDAHFNDYELFRLSLKEEGTLFRYNLGPENKGFMICPSCGHSEPLAGYRAGRGHKRLRTSGGSLVCSNDQPWTKPIAYGHQFKSFCLIARPNRTPPSVVSLAFALQRGMCRMLEIEPSEIGVSWRWLSKSTEAQGVEIVLYDRTPGGAGFVREAIESWRQVIEHATELCRTCRCEKSCYDCLKDYSNQSHHENLNRTLALEYFES